MTVGSSLLPVYLVLAGISPILEIPLFEFYGRRCDFLQAVSSTSLSVYWQAVTTPKHDRRCAFTSISVQIYRQTRAIAYRFQRNNVAATRQVVATPRTPSKTLSCFRLCRDAISSVFKTRGNNTVARQQFVKLRAIAISKTCCTGDIAIG